MKDEMLTAAKDLLTVTCSRVASGGWDVALMRGDNTVLDVVRAKIRPKVVRVGVQRKGYRLQLLRLQLHARPDDRRAIKSEIKALEDTPIESIEVPRIYEYGSRPAVMTQVWNRTTRAVEMLGYLEVQP